MHGRGWYKGSRAAHEPPTSCPRAAHETREVTASLRDALARVHMKERKKQTDAVDRPTSGDNTGSLWCLLSISTKSFPRPWYFLN